MLNIPNPGRSNAKCRSSRAQGVAAGCESWSMLFLDWFIVWKWNGKSAGHVQGLSVHGPPSNSQAEHAHVLLSWMPFNGEQTSWASRPVSSVTTESHNWAKTVRYVANMLLSKSWKRLHWPLQSLTSTPNRQNSRGSTHEGAWAWTKPRLWSRTRRTQ